MRERRRLDFDRAKERMALAQQAIESGLGADGDVEKLYRRRAAMLARVEKEVGEAHSEGVVVFRLGEGRYGVPMTEVAEVIPRPRIAPAPGSPAEIAGLLQVRGEIRVVWDLRRLVGLSPGAAAGEMRTVVLLRNGKGLLVEEVEDVRRVEEKERRAAPGDSMHGVWMTEDLVVVLDVEGLLAREREA